MRKEGVMLDCLMKRERGDRILERNGESVERLYCKRPILCLASSKILTPRLWCGGRTHSLGGEGGGGSIFWKTPGTALYSTYVSTLWAKARGKKDVAERHGCSDR